MQRALAVNTIAPMLMMQAVLPVMALQRGGGSIVNVSSGMGAMSEMGALSASYRVSKCGLNALTVVAAAEFEGRVRVNAVCPGFVDTRMTAALDAVKTSPDDAAAQLLWLCDVESVPSGGFWRNGEGLYW